MNIDNKVTEMYCESIGQSVFMSVGYVCVFFLLVEFAALIVIREEWCYYLWLGIPFGPILVAGDSLFIFKNKDKIDNNNSSVFYAWILLDSHVASAAS